MRPALYYPKIPVLEHIARSQPGRIIGYNCLPAALAQTQRLRDIRGYDAVDPARFVNLMGPVADSRSFSIPYALTQWLTPKFALDPPSSIRLHPILDMFGVRYVIFRGVPPAGLEPEFRGDDYWALVNRKAVRERLRAQTRGGRGGRQGAFAENGGFEFRRRSSVLR